ncbi:hypothetical protein [Schaalia canis]|uniref:Uncharacterized protein n=1 Tax=Schaalia canis TaxID=100469 RepID=A0A3P1SCR6_9ACTO|nr:hypothetical protein [Schaalia canis]RRC94757.1 hypothetical protein EII11_08660 [Schaalia canis]
MSTSYTHSIHNPLLLWRPLVVASAILALSTLSGCASTNASSDDFATQSTEVVETPESDATTETEQPQAEYKKPENRPDYKEVIDNWYKQDIEVTQVIGESDTDEDLEKRAQFIAALYLKHTEEDSRQVLQNNYVGLDDRLDNSANPIFGSDILTCSDKDLNSALSAQYLFPVLANLEAFHNGKQDRVQEINYKTFHALKGHIRPYPNSESLGFERAHFHALLQDPNEEPTQPETRTVRISDEDVAVIGILENGYKPPVSEKYPTFWVKVTPKDGNPHNIALIQAVTAVSLSDAAGQIPDFNGNTRIMEALINPEDYPVSFGHPKSEVTIPVIRTGYVVTLDKLPDSLK